MGLRKFIDIGIIGDCQLLELTLPVHSHDSHTHGTGFSFEGLKASFLVLFHFRLLAPRGTGLTVP